MYIVVSCLVGIGVDVLRVLLASCEYCCTMGVLLYFTLDSGLLARSQHLEGPTTGHLDKGFFLVSLGLKPNAEMVSNIPSCHYMLLIWPSRLNLVVTNFIFCIYV